MAHASLAGLSVRDLIRAEPLERVILDRVAARAIEIQAKHRQDLANRIIGTLVKGMKGSAENG